MIAITNLWIGTWQNVSKVLIVYLLFDLWILLLEMYSFSVFNITFSLLRKKKKKEWDDTKEIKVQGDREGLGNVWDEKHGGQN